MIRRKQILNIAISLLLLVVFPGCIPSSSAQSYEQEGAIYLTVSEITFSIAGEQENIYIGTAPVQSIHWYSEDASVVAVEDGVLTAIGAGETVIHAQLGQQHWQCKAGCLASDEQEYAAVSHQLKREAKRIPPVTDYDFSPFFQDAAICGDSISWFFGQFEMKNNFLEHPLFLARCGCSITGYLIHSKELFYKGAECPLADAVADSGVNYLFIMLGQNDLGFLSVDETVDNYDKLIGVIREESPDVQIFLETCTLQTASSDDSTRRNQNIREFNARLVPFAEEHNCQLVDVAIYAEDHYGNLPEDYHFDLGIHLNDVGCNVWAQVLKNYAQLYEIRIGETK